ncbi:MAG: LysM domain-containing protein [Gammaproteobacteria bacterium]|nr:LysM domain-containing protein [Gammaproteobacteria bacterium]
MTATTMYYEYKIKNGDTFSGIIHSMFGYALNDTRYAETVKHLLALNPQIKNPGRIRAGDMLRLGVLPPTPTSSTNPIIPPTFITKSVHSNNMENFWALAWLEQNSNFLTIPGGIATGAAGNLLSPGNVNLINEISDHYADYKLEKITKAQYDYRRKQALDQLKKNVGPIEKLLFGNHTTHESIRIARAGGIPATAHITQHADRLKNMAAASKGAGIVLIGVGLTAACMKIASTTDTKEKNEIFVETITSTVMGVGSGYVVGAFLVSNPIGWGAAILLAAGSVALSYGSGKGASFLAYDVFGMEVDLVSGSGIDRVCQ